MRRPRTGVFLAALCGVAAAGSLPPAARAASPGPRVHALLLNGGDRAGSNYLSHLHHLQDMVALLRARGVPAERIHVFSADGQDPAADLSTREPEPADFWILEDTPLGNRLRPPLRLVDTAWEGVTLNPARLANLRAWFESSPRNLAAGDQLLLFVTDHGTGDAKDPEAGAISLWNEKLTVRDLRALLGHLPAGVQVVTVMSQCFSGAFAALAGSAEPTGAVCGFFSTTARQKAYGCYPEGRDRDQMGHAFHFIDAWRRQATAAEAHADVLAEDDTPDVPLRTTDAYLARVVAAEAAARGTDETALADALLARAWREGEAWEPEVRLLNRIAAAFGTLSPRRLEEVRAREQELDALARELESHTDRWKDALRDLRRAVVEGFLSARPQWRARVEPEAVRALSDDERAALVAELLPDLLAHARGDAGLGPKLETFHAQAERGAEALWRMEVRKAALQRMRTLLVSVAGRVLVGDRSREAPLAEEGQAARREALARLDRCEAFQPGRPVATEAERRPARAPFPPVRDEVALLAELAPSWLGVQFKAVTAAARASRSLPEGANLVEAVYPGSPAEEAGLEPGDIVLGPPQRPFAAPREMREWAMTSPRGVPLPLLVVRPGADGTDTRPFEAALVLRAAPADLPRLAGPPGVGDRAPALPASLEPVGAKEPAAGAGPHLLFFWATWCAPCKAAVPELLALARSRGLPAVAISDEDAETVRTFLAARRDAFPTHVAVDPLRRSFISYGVSGTPTFVLVDAEGMIRHRQTGYSKEKGLTLPGWRWTRD